MLNVPDASIFVPRRDDRPALHTLPWWCGASATLEPSRYLRLFPHHGATPLYRMSGLAAQLRIRSVYVKDESTRLNLSSFKALGGAYAVLRTAHRIAEKKLARDVDPGELTSPAMRALMKDVVVCCASDGNHGRSVAYGARLVGATCKVFLHAGVTRERASHIERQGGQIVRVDGSYDASVHAARKAVDDNGWILVPDIALDDDPATAMTCGYVMEGYSIIVDEILRETAASGVRFTHVFVQAGVGGLAASIFGHWSVRDPTPPSFVVVEPELADCLLQSAKAGAPVTVAQQHSTIMAMLECQQPSPLAWPVVHALADAYVAVSEDDARAAVRRLAYPAGTDPIIESGESGAAGLAGLVRALEAPHPLPGLGPDSVALVISTEAPTDRSVWSGR